MTYKVGINGFGRIGRQRFKAIHEGGFEDLFEVVAVNDLAPPDTLATLLKYDSTFGRFDAEISSTADSLVVNGKQIAVSAEKEPRKLPWKKHQVDIVIESTGLFTSADKAQGHLKAGAKKVIISAPGKDEDITVVLGVNEGDYKPDEHQIISNASCTTNCLAPVAKVMLDNFGIKRGMMTTVHAYTNDQVVLDGPHKDARRARAAALNIIPTSTGAARALSLVIPELKGKFDGTSLRVPTPTVSIIDFVIETEKDATVESINNAFKQAAASEQLEGILGYTEEPLVSSDFRADSRSSIVDGQSTMVLGDRLVKVLAWYDNEWAYACRVADLVALICERGVDQDN
ncbi:MAG: type I glyceraldehyde-3-phosphate dehydrogenase [Thermomicrobiales bacterium]|nr:type I glyceraldehyde-3-phosphate dehydrogenase [Thermomicrobiales bacterium]